MKTLLNIATLAFAALLAICMAGKPLFKDESAPHEIIGSRVVEPTKLACIVIRQVAKGNGLVKFQFKNDWVCMEIWAINQEAAMRKFQRKTGAMNFDRIKNQSGGNQPAIFLVKFPA